MFLAWSIFGLSMLQFALLLLKVMNLVQVSWILIWIPVYILLLLFCIFIVLAIGSVFFTRS